MAEINIKYTDSGGGTHIASTYQCIYESTIYAENPSKEVVYITEKDPIECTSTTKALTSNSYVFKVNKIYFVQIYDLQNNEIVELTRIYQEGNDAHNKVYGVCNGAKCKVEVTSKKDFENGVIDLTNKIKGGIARLVSTTTDTGYVKTWTFSYPDGFNMNNCSVIATFELCNNSKVYCISSYNVSSGEMVNFVDIRMNASNIKVTLRTRKESDSTNQLEILLYKFGDD